MTKVNQCGVYRCGRLAVLRREKVAADLQRDCWGGVAQPLTEPDNVPVQNLVSHFVLLSVAPGLLEFLIEPHFCVVLWPHSRSEIQVVRVPVFMKPRLEF